MGVRDRFAPWRTQMRATPEDIYQPIYDRANYAAAGATSLSFFTNALGASVTLIRAGATGTVTKTSRDTYLQQPGVLPSKAFNLLGFSVCYVPLQQAVAQANTQSILDDQMRLAYGGYLIFNLLDKPYLYLPLCMIPGVGVFRGAMAGNFTAGNTGASGGGPGNGVDAFWLGVPLTIDPYQQFSATLNWDGTVSLVQTFDIYLIMHGYVRRPAQ